MTSLEYSWPSGARVILAALVFASSLLATIVAFATPPEYLSFRRAQQIDYQPDESEILRIWCIYIGQGDALLIEYPGPFSPGSPDRDKLLVDGGPSGGALRAFLDAYYGQATAIEDIVLTHHDRDHLKGITALLNHGGYGVQDLFHNGLASWGLKSRLFPGPEWPARSESVRDGETRGLGIFEDEGPDLQAASLITDRATLLADAAGFVGEYRSLADAVKSSGVATFSRTHLGSSNLAASLPTGVTITPLWPPVTARGFGATSTRSPDWSHTINGNSVVFRLDYGDFSMLFTGDLNEASEERIHTRLTDLDRLDELHTDVLKVPHHGSGHGIKPFFDQVDPVLSVASMGGQGFLTNWKHPSTDVIRWLGGHHRVYSTFVEERRFNYAELTKEKRKTLVEKKNILIETDGRFFRVVEVVDPSSIPSVQEVRRGDGTRWISALEEQP